MKTYVKPTVDVVELSVRENMAALPSGISSETTPLSIGAYGDVVTTVYDLTDVAISSIA